MTDAPSPAVRGPSPERRRPLVARLPRERPDRALIMAAHDRAVGEGRDGYHDPTTGFFVFTAVALWERHRCCGSGCRHCPYDPGPRA